MMLGPLLTELDDRIVRNAELDAEVFEQLTTQQRELGLVFGDRPTCPFLRPHIISRSQYDEVKRAAQIIAAAVEKLVDCALRDDHLLGLFDLTPREAQMARVEP